MKLRGRPRALPGFGLTLGLTLSYLALIVLAPLVASIICLIVGGAIGAAQGYWIAYHRIPSFIVTLAGMLIFRGMCQALLGGGSSVGPLPDDFKALSSGFLPDYIGSLTLIPPTENAAHKIIVGSGVVLHMTTVVIGILGVAAYVFFGLRARRTRQISSNCARPSNDSAAPIAISAPPSQIHHTSGFHHRRS